MVSQQDIQALVDAIAADFHPQRIILFGSHASGQAHADSDVDLLVVMPIQGPRYKSAAAIRARLSPDIPVDIVVRTPEEFAAAPSQIDPLLMDARKHGRLLYPVAA